MPDLYQAQINGIPLQIENIDDTFEKSIVRHEFPYRDGALLEDLGQKARLVKMRCYFWDDGAAETIFSDGTRSGGGNYTYNDHIELLNLLEGQNLFSLIHPQYGTLKGCIESVQVRHDDRQMLAEIDLTFVENLRTVIAEAVYEEILTAIEVAVRQAQDQQQEELAQELAAEGLDAATELDDEMSLLDQVKAGTAYLRDMTKELDAMIGKAEGTLNEVMQPVNSLISTINYAANLPGRILGTITKAVERVAKLYSSIIGFPDRFSRNLRFELNRLIKSFESFGGSSKGSKKARAIVVKHLKIASAQILVLELATSYKADQQARSALAATEGTVAFDTMGNWLNPDQPPAVATVNELEASLVIYTAADAFSMELANPETIIKAGQRCELYVNDRLELTGISDRRTRSYDKAGLKLTIDGRDLAGLLVDSHCTTFPTVQGKKLKELAELLLKDIPFIKRSEIIYQDEAAQQVGKLKGKKKSVDNPLMGFVDTPQKLAHIEPGMTVFEVLKIYAASRGLMFWTMPDGKLVFGRPRAKGEPQFSITMTRNGVNNTAKSVDEVDDIARRYSRVTVIGQQQGQNEFGMSVNAIPTKGEATDSSFPFDKPFVTRDNNDAQSPELRARFLLEHQRHDGYTLAYTMPGHSQNRRNWQINELCRVKDDILGIDGVYLIYARAFELSRTGGKTTTVKLGTPGLIMEAK